MCWSFSLHLQAIEHNTRSTRIQTSTKGHNYTLCSMCGKDKIIYTCALLKWNKKKESSGWQKKGGHTVRAQTSFSESVCKCVWVRWRSLEPTGAQHTQGKHHWTQSRVSRYWACLSAGLYFSPPHSCFCRFWPQFHRGHLLIKGKDWNLQVLSVFIVSKEIQLSDTPTVCEAWIHQRIYGD